MTAGGSGVFVNGGNSFGADGTLVPSSAIPTAVTNAWQATVSGTVRF